MWSWEVCIEKELRLSWLKILGPSPRVMGTTWLLRWVETTSSQGQAALAGAEGRLSSRWQVSWWNCEHLCGSYAALALSAELPHEGVFRLQTGNSLWLNLVLPHWAQLAGSCFCVLELPFRVPMNEHLLLLVSEKYFNVNKSEIFWLFGLFGSVHLLSRKMFKEPTHCMKYV